jgi:hypothetical protein
MIVEKANQVSNGELKLQKTGQDLQSLQRRGNLKINRNMRKNYLMNVFMVMIVVVLVTTIPQNVYSQTTQEAKEQKAKQVRAKKIYASLLKTLKQQGWETTSSTKTLEMQIYDFSVKKEQNPTFITIEGEVSNCKSINVCKQTALTNAQNEYLQLISGKLKGAFGSVFKANANMPSEEIDKTVGNITKQCEADLSGSLIPCYSLVKESNGLKQYRSIFLADPSKMVGTMERSLKETKLTIEEINTITKFVNDELGKEATKEE